MLFSRRHSGFTLIELIVVIAIIGLLASVVTASMNSARKKARDAAAISRLGEVRTALELYYDAHGSYPPNVTPGNEACDRNKAATFAAALQPLVDESFIPQIPTSPRSDGKGFCYYSYGDAPALLVADLETVAPTTTGPFGSCRPFTDNWCASNIASAAYCVCLMR